jgi:hypothetical protein
VAGMGVGGIFSGALVIMAHSREYHSAWYL